MGIVVMCAECDHEVRFGLRLDRIQTMCHHQSYETMSYQDYKEQELAYQRMIGIEPGVPAIQKENHMTRTIKKKTGIRGQGVTKPKCPRHDVDMSYEPAIGRWMCTTAGCKATAKRRDDEDPTAVEPPATTVSAKAMVPQEMNIDPAIPMRLTIVTGSEEDRYILTVMTTGGIGVDLEVTDNVETVIDDQTNSVSLVLLFDNAKRV